MYKEFALPHYKCELAEIISLKLFYEFWECKTELIQLNYRKKVDLNLVFKIY